MAEKDSAAERLISWHFKIDPATVEVYRFSDDEESEEGPIKLLEVNEDTFETGRVDPFAFGPADDIPYPTVIAVITPREMDRIRAGEISLPRGWNLANATRFEAPVTAHAGR